MLGSEDTGADFPNRQILASESSCCPREGQHEVDGCCKVIIKTTDAFEGSGGLELDGLGRARLPGDDDAWNAALLSGKQDVAPPPVLCGRWTW